MTCPGQLQWTEPRLYEEGATIADLRKLAARAKHAAVKVRHDMTREVEHLHVSPRAVLNGLKFKGAADPMTSRLDLDGWLWIGA